jgi:hypothetical protein
MVFRLGTGRPIGHRVPLGFVLFTAIFLWIVYRLRRDLYPQHVTSPASSVTELSGGTAGDHPKSA